MLEAFFSKVHLADVSVGDRGEKRSSLCRRLADQKRRGRIAARATSSLKKKRSWRTPASASSQPTLHPVTSQPASSRSSPNRPRGGERERREGETPSHHNPLFQEVFVS